MTDDGLRQPDQPDDDPWLFEPTPTTFDELVAALSKPGETRQVVWSARRDGRLVPPPDSHVLDALVRESVHVGASVEWDMVFTLRPTAGTIAIVDGVDRPCDLCGERPRRYDAHLQGNHTAAFMCAECFLQRSTGLLGTGHGQLLMHLDEVSDVVRDRYAPVRSLLIALGAPMSAADPSLTWSA